MTRTGCPHWDDVSAAIDGELPEPAASRSLDHASRCAYCGPLLTTITAPSADTSHRSPPIGIETLSPRERRWLRARWSRWLLAVSAVVIVAEAIPVYATGHGHGLYTEAHVHAARHLATWQLGFGVGLLVAALMSRLTHAMLALATTFATLTITATVIDVINGHSGPWAESVHFIELVAIILLWHLTPPHLLPWHRRAAHRHQPGPAPVDDRQPLRLVPPGLPTTDDDRAT